MYTGGEGYAGMAAPIPNETRAAVMAALLAGQSVSAVARQFKISRGTVSKWRSAAGLGDVAPVTQEKRDEIGEMLIGYLRNLLATLSLQAEHVRDQKWIHKQSGADFAVAHGVLADKAFRILEALEAGSDQDRPVPPA